MKILLIGSGGREHAIAWKLAQSEQVTQIYVAPGNGGTAQLEKAQNVPIPVDDLQSLHDFALDASSRLIWLSLAPAKPQPNWKAPKHSPKIL